MSIYDLLLLLTLSWDGLLIWIAIVCIRSLTASKINWRSLRGTRLLASWIGEFWVLRVGLDPVHHFNVTRVSLLLFCHAWVWGVWKCLLFLDFGLLEWSCWICSLTLLERSAHLQRVVRIFTILTLCIILWVWLYDTRLVFIVLSWPLTIQIRPWERLILLLLLRLLIFLLWEIN